MPSKHVGIAKLRHRLEVCSARDEIQDGQISLSRKAVFTAWASVSAAKPSFFAKDGQVIKQDRETETHKIMMRYRADVNISSAAWLYEERRKSAPRWFKILGVNDYEEEARYWVFKCRLVEASDNVIRPVTEEPEKAKSAVMGGVPLPAGVKL